MLAHSRVLARVHTRARTHTCCTHTQTRTHLYASSKQKRFSSRKNRNFNLTPENNTCLKRKHVRMYTHTRPQRISTSLQKSQKRVTDKHTYNIRARSLARSHSRAHTSTHTHTYCIHTQTRTHSYASSKQKRFTKEQKF